MANKVKGFLVDVENCCVKNVEFEDTLESIYRLLNVDYIDVAIRKIGNHIYDIICDDEGLLKGNAIPSALDSDGNPQLVGNLLIVKASDDGNFASLSDEDFENLENHVVQITLTNSGLKVNVMCGVEYV